jgi:hypothetical protein
LKVWPAFGALALLAGSSASAVAQGVGPVRWPPTVVATANWRAAPSHSLFLAPSFTSLIATRIGSGADSTVIPPTHWKTGALIGGTALGLLTALTTVSLCGYDEGDCHGPALWAAGGFAFGGVVGFGLGALIGGQFPARTP